MLLSCLTAFILLAHTHTHTHQRIIHRIETNRYSIDLSAFAFRCFFHKVHRKTHIGNHQIVSLSQPFNRFLIIH